MNSENSGNGVIAKKLRAAERFVERLLDSAARDSIAKVILHGSVAMGTARPESDIDLLVFGVGGSEIIEIACDDAYFETLMETEESVEPLVYPIGDYRYPPSYFIYHALWRGREVYSMSKEELKELEIDELRHLAQEYLQGAEDCLERGQYRLAIDVGYNAAELAAKAFLFMRLDDLPSTHSGVVNRFSELYVQSGLFPRAMGRGLSRGLRNRNRARYQYRAHIGEEEATEAVDLARNLIAALEERLDSPVDERQDWRAES